MTIANLYYIKIERFFIPYNDYELKLLQQVLKYPFCSLTRSNTQYRNPYLNPFVSLILSTKGFLSLSNLLSDIVR